MSTSVQPELMKRYKDSQICPMYVCRMSTSKISTFGGIKLSVSQRYAFRCDPGRTVQVKITGLRSASDRLGFVRSRNRSKQWADKINFTNSKTWCRDRPSRALPLTCPNVKNLLKNNKKETEKKRKQKKKKKRRKMKKKEKTP